MDRDVIEMFREKNKLILINNLKYDLDKNINSLVETITNIFNNEFDIAITNIISINEDSGIIDSDKFITSCINKLKLQSHEDIQLLLDDKKKSLETAVNKLEFDEDHLNEYFEIVLEGTKLFKISLQKTLNSHVQEQDINPLHKFITENVDSEYEKLAISRITDYLKNRLYGKLETKIHMEIMLRDNNLINKAKEGYLRYQEISSKTTNE